jgi:hypothetical protein
LYSMVWQASLIHLPGSYLFAPFKPKRLLNESFSQEEYNKLRIGNRFAFVIYSSTAILAIWLPYIALTINVAVWMLWIWISLMEKE